eukprot:3101916-Pleurochrysis_carterae.AAC.3
MGHCDASPPPEPLKLSCTMPGLLCTGGTKNLSLSTRLCGPRRHPPPRVCAAVTDAATRETTTEEGKAAPGGCVCACPAAVRAAACAAACVGVRQQAVAAAADLGRACRVCTEFARRVPLPDAEYGRSCGEEDELMHACCAGRLPHMVADAPSMQACGRSASSPMALLPRDTPGPLWSALQICSKS